jgi:tRNA (cytidine/uridine-2'-O-)-methyltransferase
MMINIVLFEPEIAGNVGNIIRTCAAAGAKLHLIEPFGFIWNEKLIKRTGANHIDDCEYSTYENLEDFFSKNTGEFYFVTRYGKKTHSSFDYSNNDNIYFFFGKESTGLPKELLSDNIENCLRIPMKENIRSLNVSNTVAIVVYESLRQRNFEGLSFKEVIKGEDYLSQ